MQHDYEAPVDDQYVWPRCETCARDLHRDELQRLNCRPCTQRCEADLKTLPGPPTYDDKSGKLTSGLYAALAGALMPGSTGDSGRVSGSRTAPLPIRLTPLSLAAPGGTLTILQGWRESWHELLGYAPPARRGTLQKQMDDTVKALITNLDWAASAHPGFPYFAAEVAQEVRACRNAVGTERPERRVAVQCPCGAILRVTVSTPGARCRTCDTQYAREDVLELSLAERVMA